MDKSNLPLPPQSSSAQEKDKILARNFDLNQVAIRLMQKSDVDAAVRCFADHYDVFDAPVTVEVFLATSPEWCFVAIDRSRHTEQVVGAICAPVGPQQTAFIGLYGVSEQYRACGIGSKLFKHAMEQVAQLKIPNVGLYAVPEMREKYFKGGFHNAEGVFMVNYLGAPTEEHFTKLAKAREGVSIRHFNVDAFNAEDTAQRELLKMIIDFDGKILSESRQDLLVNALARKEYHTSVALAEDNLVQGYACVRQHSHTGRLMLGPVYADTPQVARALVGALLLDKFCRKDLAEKGLLLNAISAQPESLSLATEWIGLEEIERCERLFTGSPIKTSYQFIYGVFSPDFSL